MISIGVSKMRIKNLTNYIVRMYKSEMNDVRTTLILLGGSGIGKTTSVREAAKKIAQELGREYVEYSDKKARQMLGRGFVDSEGKKVEQLDPAKHFVFVDFRLTECEPSDLIGVPQYDPELQATFFAPMLWTIVLSKCPGILFLDELTNTGRDDLVSIAYKIVEDRKVGFTELHPDVMVIAAGNRVEDSSIARMLPAPLTNRLTVIKLGASTVDEWKDFMDDRYGNAWDRRTYFFLKRFENDNYLYQPVKEVETLDAFPTPRSWTRLARYMHKGFTDLDTIFGCIGEEVGQKLHAFLKTNVDLDEILSDPKKYTALTIDGKFMLTSMLVTYITNNLENKAGIQRVLQLFDVMVSDNRELAVVLLTGLEKKIRTKFITHVINYKPAYGELFVDILQLKHNL